MNVSAFQVSDTNRSAIPVQPVSLHVSNLTQVDVFKPEFSSSKTLPMNIKLTDVSELPLIDSENHQNAVYPNVDFYR